LGLQTFGEPCRTSARNFGISGGFRRFLERELGDLSGFVAERVRTPVKERE
jgi:hypothetical protein